MVKRILSATTIVLVLAFFNPASAQLFKFLKNKKRAQTETSAEVKFLDIEAGFDAPSKQSIAKGKGPKHTGGNAQYASIEAFDTENAAIEKASFIQLKYSILLDTEVEHIKNTNLFNLIDDWFGTRYVYGGTSKKGIDCSAFVQVMYAGLFGFTLPRTAREQHKAVKPIKKSELTEGDLVFFNTTGGVSHVGIYLQNNKFVHAATSGGVMISDLDDSYWSRRYLSSGRYQGSSEGLLFVSKP